MRANAKILIILNSIESLFTAWAFMKAGRMEPGNILVGVVFMLAFFLYRNISVRLSLKPFAYAKNVRYTAIVLSVLYTIFYMAVDYPRYIETLTNKLYQLIASINCYCFFFLIAGIKKH